jgi:hypothetical protein
MMSQVQSICHSSEAFDHLFPLASALLTGGLVLHDPEGRNALWVHDKMNAASLSGTRISVTILGRPRRRDCHRQ